MDLQTEVTIIMATVYTISQDPSQLVAWTFSAWSGSCGWQWPLDGGRPEISANDIHFRMYVVCISMPHMFHIPFNAAV